MPAAAEADREEAPALRTQAWIAAQDLSRVRRAIEALSERGRRLGTGPLELEERERRTDEVLVALVGKVPRLEGWEVVGELKHRSGGPGEFSFAAPALNRRAWSGAEPWCEHCGLLRRRTATYLVQHSSGEVRQIGSSCLRNFTGHDLSRVVRQAELTGRGSALLRRAALPGGSVETRQPPLDQFLAMVLRIVREQQGGVFVPRSCSSDQSPASVDVAWDRWQGGERPEAEQLDDARALTAWGLSHLGARGLRSEYARRLRRLLERGGRVSRREAPVLAGLVAVEERWRLRAFLAPVGERVDAVMRVHAVKEAGRNRFGEVIWHGMRDERGRWASWFASGGRRLTEGNRYRVRGRVRRHGEWRGRPVTVLERCIADPLAVH